MAKTTQNWDYLIARREREFYKDYRKRHAPPVQKTKEHEPTKN